MDATVIIMIVLVIVALYGLYAFIQGWSVLTKGLIDMSTTQTIDVKNINSPTAKTFYYSAWFYINGTSSGSLLDRELTVCVHGSTLYLKLSNNKDNTITEQFPTNRWVFFVINVVNGKFVEVYLNGKLVKSIQLAAELSISETSNLQIGNSAVGGSVSGYMTKLIRKPNSIDASTIWSTYLQGNGKYAGMLFGILDYLESLGLKIDLSRNGTLQREITLGNVESAVKK